jgi:cell division septation protein DedD
MPALLGKQAVVVGAGIGGLSAAGALSGHFENVVVLERDKLAEHAAPRAGTPQAQHLHALLGGGVRALEALFPGFTTALKEASAATYRMGLDILSELPGFDPFPQRDLGWDGFSMSRPLAEYTVRRKLLERPNITLRDRCAAPIAVGNAHSTAVVAPSVSGGGFAVQVTSERNESNARAALQALLQKYPNQLSGRQPIIRRVDLGAKGIYYRVLVAPFASAEEAAGLCGKLKAAGRQLHSPNKLTPARRLAQTAVLEGRASGNRRKSRSAIAGRTRGGDHSVQDGLRGVAS